MKKHFILLMVVMFISTSIYAEPETFGSVLTGATETIYQDGKNIVDTLYHDGKAAIKTVYEDAKTGLYPDIKTAISHIAEGIGVAAEHVYVVLVKKFLVDGVKELAVFILGIFLLILSYCQWSKLIKNEKRITYKSLIPGIFALTGIITVLCVDFNELFMGLINPEYGAINYILEYSKTLFQ